MDSRGTVQDIQFAPSHQGLKLATVSVYGVLRIYEAMDVINLAHWTLTVIYMFGHRGDLVLIIVGATCRRILKLGCRARRRTPNIA